MSYELAEMLRRMDSMIRTGTIEEADYPNARVRVRSKGILSDWIPWTTERVGKDRTWSPPDIGEQVIMLCPSGDPAQGVVLKGVYQDSAPANGDNPDIHRTDYAGGSYIEHNRATGKLIIHAAGDIDITADGNIKIKGVRIDFNP